jgi:hypothetical protein
MAISAPGVRSELSAQIPREGTEERPATAQKQANLMGDVMENLLGVWAG